MHDTIKSGIIELKLQYEKLLERAKQAGIYPDISRLPEDDAGTLIKVLSAMTYLEVLDSQPVLPIVLKLDTFKRTMLDRLHADVETIEQLIARHEMSITHN
jgi:hypothetical protein